MLLNGDIFSLAINIGALNLYPKENYNANKKEKSFIKSRENLFGI